MRIAIITCLQYSDAWQPFRDLFNKFWPDCPYPLEWIYSSGQAERTWCQDVADIGVGSEPILLFQEDFFLIAPVRDDLIRYGLDQMQRRRAGAVRLYPCPGANQDYGDPHFGLVKKGTRYRISCQASIWRPDFLRYIARRCNDHGEAADFETGGSRVAESLNDEVLAFKRDSGPWPIEYLCSAIAKGHWNPDALRLCERHKIPLDLSRRPVATA